MTHAVCLVSVSVATITPVWWANLRRFMVLCGLASLLACQRTHSSEGPKRLVIYQEDAAQAKDLVQAEHRALGEDTGDHARYGRSGWRPFYRLVLNGDRPAELEAWAEVTNRSGLDWKRVTLTLTTGGPPPRAKEESASSPGTRRTSARQGHTDQDEDGIADMVDTCPESPEDFDGYEDDDGCPDPDNDHDRILDIEDLCPDENETYNGIEDEDGCPDKGSVHMTGSYLGIEPKIYFKHKDVVLDEHARAVLDAVAAQFAGNPDVELAEIVGHCSIREKNCKGVGFHRALSVASYLVEAGVDPARLHARRIARPPVGTRGSKDEGTSRRVEFEILKRRSPSAVQAWPRYRGFALPRRIATTLNDASSHIAVAVSLEDGETRRIPVTDSAARGQEVYFYRSSAKLSGNNLHVSLAVRLLNDGDMSLAPGSIVLVRSGETRVASLVDVLKPGEQTFIALEREEKARFQVRESRSASALRILSIGGGTLRVEDAHEIATEYRMHPGLAPARALYVQHLRHRDYVFTDAPQAVRIRTFGPGALDKGNTTIEVRESRLRKRRVALAAVGASELRSYAAGTALPASIQELVIGLAEVSEAIGGTETQMETLRRQVLVAQLRAHEIWRVYRTSPSSRVLKSQLVALQLESKTQTANLEGLAQTVAKQLQLRETLLKKLGQLTLLEFQN